MKKNFLKLFCCLLALTILFCSCGPKSTNKDVDLSKEFGDYPLESDTTLTYWVELNGNVSATATNLAETPFAKELEKRTGVKVEYLHPAMGQTAEAFSLMLASGELPDIIEYNWSAIPGGASGAIDDEIVVELNPYMEKYAPNLTAFLKENADINNSVKTDAGQYYCFPFIRSDKSLLMSNGPVVRTDWLKDLGMEYPASVEEWEDMLTKFKDIKGATIPLTITKNDIGLLIRLCVATNSLYVDDGKIKYGPMEPEFKEALVTLNRWYEKGLLDKNFVSTDGTMQDSNMLNGKSGATFASGGSGIGRWLDTMGSNSSFDLTGVKYPGSTKEENTRFLPYADNYPGGGSATITTACKNIPLAVKYLDYGYSQDGTVLNNFGIEGESFVWENEYPKYTDLVTKNTEGLSMSQAMGKYMRSNYLGPFVQDKKYIEQYYAYPQQKEALNNWLLGFEESKANKLPKVSLTVEESSEYSVISTEIQKYLSTMISSYISGIESFDDFDKFISTLKNMKVDRMIEIYQNAYDRYQKR